MIVSQEVISEIDLEEFNPGKIIDQLQFSPDIFPFLKSREHLMGAIRPILIYCVGLAIWAFKKGGTQKRDIPDGFLESLWTKIAANRELTQKLGDIIEELEPMLWNFLLNIIRSETERNKDITDKELGAGCLILLVVILGLVFAFGADEDLMKLDKIFASRE